MAEPHLGHDGSDCPPCDLTQENGCSACGAPTPEWCQRPGGYQPPQPVVDDEPCEVAVLGGYDEGTSSGLLYCDAGHKHKPEDVRRWRERRNEAEGVKP